MTPDQALAELAAAGLRVEALDTSGRLVRCPVETDKGAKRSGWYVVHEHQGDDGQRRLVGAYGNHKTGTGTLTLRLDWRDLAPSERESIKRRQEALRAQAGEAQKQAAATAAERAASIWAKLPDAGTSEYLRRKGVGAYGVKFARGSIVVPVRSLRGRLRGLQWIAADGAKRFLTGTEKRGACHLVGEVEDLAAGPMGIAEGYSTAAAVHEATGWPVLCAFDAGNLQPVLLAAAKRWPGRTFVICADDDAQTRRPDGAPYNPGFEYAKRAADSVPAPIACPHLAELFATPQARPETLRLDASSGALSERREPMDWCDAIGSAGRAACGAALRAVVEEWEGGPAILAGEAAEPPTSDWQLDAKEATRGWKRASQLGVELVLQHDDRWRGVLGHNLHSDQLVKRRAPPWPGGAAGEWQDRDTAHCVSWFSRSYGIEPGPAVLGAALQVAADGAQYHPIRDWLDGLGKPGTALLDVWLREAFGSVEHPDYLQAIGRAWLISAVARVYAPGCKADHVLILEGKQGRGKSSALAELFGEWYSDQPILFGDKDSYLAIRGIWCLELAELDSWRKVEHTQSKAFFSQRVDRYRPPYGHRMQEVPRQCIFAGTTNQSEYLRDPTGHRRYWPVQCEGIDLEWIAEHRADLFAEAVAAYQAGERWWLDVEGEQLAIAARESRIQEDPWEESIARWLTTQHAQRHSTEALLMEALGIDRHAITGQHQTRVAYVMHGLGWGKSRWRERGIAVRGYVAPRAEG